MMDPNNDFKGAAARIENAIASILEVAAATGDTGFIERITRLAIKKGVVLELLLEAIDPPMHDDNQAYVANTGNDTVPFGEDHLE
ncbi:hypothetical protein [Scopulibacillus cellulosilyticus]|uniref:Uncharacterized protein n=1 Tax=Scopulibacillus cellulosilyticus TaxID=2665665 RepID=A0ABW2Q441_9BACL